ncbi:S8 family serine peptidase [Phenylobacterium sp.]|uniref:S8 family serine peptidase n=1 Tax=Phenylobacterium sp. TaxID=1871053 RepID=UPI002ED7C1D1
MDQITTFRSFDVRAGTVLVTFEPGANLAALSPALKGLATAADRALDNPGAGMVRLTLAPGLDLEAALERLSHLPGVRSAQPDYVLRTFGEEDEDGDPDPTADANLRATDVSNDPGFTGGQTWGMYGDRTAKANAFGSQAGEAWTAGYTGSTKVAVGLLDTGLDYTHPDLYLNVWLNPNEISIALKAALVDTDGDGRIGFRDLNNAANSGWVSDLNANGRIDAGDLLRDSRWEDGVDQDANGYTDDLIGWDFFNHDNDPFDDAGHGTHVGGIIAAQGGNGAGVAGVTWSTQLIVAKFLGPNGGFTSGAVQALDYVTALTGAAGGGDIVATNNSWGGGGASQALTDAIVRGAQADVLFVAAAGNGGTDQVGDNNDVVPNYPSNVDTTAAAGFDAVVAVAALTSTGGLASFSNYGAVSVDVGAPGSAIYSTIPGATYGTMSGTSMATPFVTGAVAMYAAVNPGASAAQIRADLFATAAPTASLAGKTSAGGRLDISSFIYKVSPGGATIVGTSAADTVSLIAAPAGQSKASVFDDTLWGADGADKLDGGPGADRLIGGAGNDTLTVDNPGDVVVENPGEGVDLVNSAISLTLGPNVEKLTLTGPSPLTGTGNALDNTITGNGAANALWGLDGADALTGGAGDDTLTGGAGNDKLTGGTGADWMAGGAGDDTYGVDAAGDQVSEAAGEGSDLVSSTITYALGANLEKLTLTGTAAVNGTGNELANTLTGNGAVNQLDGADGADTLTGGAGADTLVGGAGNDKLTGSAGADRMQGGTGNDTYYVDDPGDVVIEAANEGVDIVVSTVAFTLGDNVEKLTLTGSAQVNGTGNALGNTITGSPGANLLSGAAGADTIIAGDGADTLDGGAGVDRLTGGAGVDRFVFQKGQAAGDNVVDFAAGETLELHGWGAGSTIARQSGSLTNWIVTDGVTGETEVVSLSNKYVLVSGDWIFT